MALPIHRPESPVISRPLSIITTVPEAPPHDGPRAGSRGAVGRSWKQQDEAPNWSSQPATDGIGYAGSIENTVTNAMRTFFCWTYVATGQYFQSLEKWTLDRDNDVLG